MNTICNIQIYSTHFHNQVHLIKP